MKTREWTEKNKDKLRCYNREWMRCHRAGTKFDKNNVDYSIPQMKTKTMKNKKDTKQEEKPSSFRKGFCTKCGIRLTKENKERCSFKDCPKQKDE